ncbi:hypothetical protein PIB30_084676 [Stylosanthes scabra]|uniref:Uncharacterized protein n=1 Tax=Stylosanthes scabra TaxID=79078 RepID=A0ABU6XS16_9FABA|nr:hypothetical protein [Stylosanthes scabra]
MCFTKHPNYLSKAWGILGKGLVKKTRKLDKSASRVWGTVLDKPKAQNLVALPAPPSTLPVKLCPDSDEGTQELSNPSPRITFLIAPIRKDTRDQVAK